MKKKIYSTIVTLMILSGLSLLLYPTASDYLNNISRAKDISTYAESVAHTDKDKYQNKHYDGDEVQNKGQNYIYPHDHPYHWTYQQYMPDSLLGTVYYEPGENKTEQAYKEYWKRIKSL